MPARGNWFQTNQPDHESDDRSLLLCVLQIEKNDIQRQIGQHFTLYCGTVKSKLQTQNIFHTSDFSDDPTSFINDSEPVLGCDLWYTWPKNTFVESSVEVCTGPRLCWA